MEVFSSLLVSVLAGVVVHYICKWLDGNDSDNQPNKESPRAATLGDSLWCRYGHFSSLVRIYYMLNNLNMSIYCQANFLLHALSNLFSRHLHHTTK